MFYGFLRHLESFSGGFLVQIYLLGCLLRYLAKNLIFNGTVKQCPLHLEIPLTWNHQVTNKRTNAEVRANSPKTPVLIESLLKQHFVLGRYDNALKMNFCVSFSKIDKKVCFLSYFVQLRERNVCAGGVLTIVLLFVASHLISAVAVAVKTLFTPKCKFNVITSRHTAIIALESFFSSLHRKFSR